MHILPSGGKRFYFNAKSDPIDYGFRILSSLETIHLLAEIAAVLYKAHQKEVI